jgi:hypothetical protein
MWFDTKTQTDAYDEEIEYGGPGRLAAKEDGQESAPDTIYEGTRTRYVPQMYGLRMTVNRMAKKFTKYSQVVEVGKMLTTSAYVTIEYDTADVAARMVNTDYPLGDGQALGSLTHTLPVGGTFSNMPATPISPSILALSQARVQISRFPGLNGLIDPSVMPKQVICPLELKDAFLVLLRSSKDPGVGEYNKINVVKEDFGELSSTPVAIPFWTSSATNWMIRTTANGGPNIRYVEKPRNRDWIDNGTETYNYAVSCMFSKGVTNPRSMYCVNA